MDLSSGEKPRIWEETCSTVLTAALFTIAKTWEQAKDPHHCRRQNFFLFYDWVILHCMHTIVYTYVYTYIYIYIYICIPVQSLCHVRLSAPHGLQHFRLPCPSLSPGACSNSYPLSQWYHPTISSSVIPFSSYLQSCTTSESFPMCQLFASGEILELQLQHQSFQWIFRIDFFSIDLLDFLAVQRMLKSLLQHHG